MLSIKNLVKEYVCGTPVLIGITLDIEGADITAIIGPSGTGKSTLIRCINRLVEPTSGEILFEGQDLAAMKKWASSPPNGKAMQLRWLRAALENLDEEGEFIATEDPRAARLVVARVFDAVAPLAVQPGLGRPGRVPGTRELVVPKTRYLIPYRVRANTVEILRVFDTSRRPPDRW